MKLRYRLSRRDVVLAHDLLMIPIAWLSAYWLRFNLDSIPPDYFDAGIRMTPIVLFIQGAIFWYFGLYRGMWRFASMPDLIRIAKAVAIGTALSAVAVFLVTRMDGVPRSVIPVYGLLLFTFVSGPRFVYRWFQDRNLYKKEGKKALIVGAGRAGETLVRDLMRDTHREYQPEMFVDDDTEKRGREIHGVRVRGTIEDISKFASSVEVILIALPSATSRQMRRVVDICEKTSKPFRTLPRIEDLISGKATIKQLRDVNIVDLLGREAVTLDWNAIRQSSVGKVVLVTGGGGSIGSELCRQIAELSPERLIVLDQSEFNLYSIEFELKRTYPKLSLIPVLADVTDSVAVESALIKYHPQIVFHAAAYKHVPMLEGQVRSAVVNNVLGTRTLATLVDKYDCERFVLISTDKAVNPSNVMGATKHAAEIYCQNFNDRSKTHFITVRFGNVLGSAGSVIPLFQKQIAEGGPVTVTDPNVTRYFMTIPEASQLILQASSIGQGGEIFVLDMGEPVNIKYLAEQLILLSGKRPTEDIVITYTGLRPGEKPYEELFYDTEELIETQHPKTLLARSRKVDIAELERQIDMIAQVCANNDEGKIRLLLDQLVRMSKNVQDPESFSRTPSSGLI